VAAVVGVALLAIPASSARKPINRERPADLGSGNSFSTIANTAADGF
jgi:hypothetical protein